MTYLIVRTSHTPQPYKGAGSNIGQIGVSRRGD